MGELLKKVKNIGSSQIMHLNDEADVILEPLMQFLDSSLTHYANNCEKTVMKKLLKVAKIFVWVTDCKLRVIRSFGE